MAGMWLSGEDLPHRGNERKISKGLNRGNAMVSETQLAFLRSIDTPTVWPEPTKKPVSWRSSYYRACLTSTTATRRG
jgi:hypothetical protein